MDVDYASAKLKKRCTQGKEMSKAYDRGICKSLSKRIVELKSAPTVGDVLAGTGNWHWMTGDLAGLLSARLSGNWRILVRPAETTNECSVVEVEDVADYH
jgi:proteic killer suppression protein